MSDAEIPQRNDERGLSTRFAVDHVARPDFEVQRGAVELFLSLVYHVGTPVSVEAGGSLHPRLTLIAFSIANLAAASARLRLAACPVFGFRPGTLTVHFQPVGLAVWSRLYGMPLCSMLG